MNPDITTVCRLLEQDMLANLVTLKMLHRFPNSMRIELHEGTDGWALLSLLDTRDSEWDRKTYPDCKHVVFINGNSDTRKLQLLASLPKENLVIKTGDEVVQRELAKNGKATKLRTFHSFTTPPFSEPISPNDSRTEPLKRTAPVLGRSNVNSQAGISSSNAGAVSPSPLRSGGEGRGEEALRVHGEVEARPTTPRQSVFAKTSTQSSRPDERAWAMFRANGYEDQELAQYFQNGAQWFGIESEGKLASACFTFQNYKQIWEIGGVFTQSNFRRRGLAQIVVRGALNYLAASGLIPRYQTTTENHASLALARSCSLAEFLQMAHYLLDRR